MSLDCRHCQSSRVRVALSCVPVVAALRSASDVELGLTGTVIVIYPLLHDIQTLESRLKSGCVGRVGNSHLATPANQNNNKGILNYAQINKQIT